MLNYIVPIVMYCAVVAGETSKCDGTTKIYSETLDAVDGSNLTIVAPINQEPPPGITTSVPAFVNDSPFGFVDEKTTYPVFASAIVTASADVVVPELVADQPILDVYAPAEVYVAVVVLLGVLVNDVAIVDPLEVIVALPEAPIVII